MYDATVIKGIPVPIPTTKSVFILMLRYGGDWWTPLGVPYETAEKAAAHAPPLTESLTCIQIVRVDDLPIGSNQKEAK